VYCYSTKGIWPPLLCQGYYLYVWVKLTPRQQKFDVRNSKLNSCIRPVLIWRGNWVLLGRTACEALVDLFWVVWLLALDFILILWIHCCVCVFALVWECVFVLMYGNRVVLNIRTWLYTFITVISLVLFSRFLIFRLFWATDYLQLPFVTIILNSACITSDLRSVSLLLVQICNISLTFCVELLVQYFCLTDYVS
jgi:hypothetical protein